MPKLKYNIAAIGLICLLMVSCNPIENNPVYNPELVFSDAFEISTLTVNYNTELNLCTFSISNSSVVDTVDASPKLCWRKVPSELLSVSISTAPIRSSNGEISNINDIIWQWNSGMSDIDNQAINDTLAVSIIDYNKGKLINNGIFNYDTQPLSLENGLYYWAVWAWDNTGKCVTYSSKSIPIYVE